MDQDGMLQACRAGDMEKIKRVIRSADQVNKICKCSPEKGLNHHSHMDLCGTDVTPFWEAIHGDHLNVVKYFVDELHADVNGLHDVARHTNYVIPLIACCVFGRKRIAEYLMDKQADINIVSYGGYTPLIISAFYDQVRCVTLKSTFAFIIDREAREKM